MRGDVKLRERENSQNGNGRSSAGKIAQYGLLIALAFIFSYVEALIPLPVPVPGIKLGLANLVNVVGLQQSGQYAVRAGRRCFKPCGHGAYETDGLV